MVITLVIPGKPIVKKNSRSWGRGRPYKSAALRDYETQAITALRSQWGDRPPIDYPVWCHTWIWVPDKRRRDISNLLEAIQDALEGAEIVTNDSLLVPRPYPLRISKERPETWVRLERI